MVFTSLILFVLFVFLFSCISLAFRLRFYRAMHYSAKRGIEIACRLSVCLSVRL